MRTVQLRRCVPAIVALTLAAGPLRGQTIGTSPSNAYWDKLGGAGPTRTIGQTFTAPNAYMIDFSFWLEESTLPFKAYVYEWDAGASATGDPLFASDVLTVPSGAGGYIEVNVPTGLSLTTGSTYVAFFSTYWLTPIVLSSKMEMSYPYQAYPDGQVVFLFNGDPAAATWNDGPADLHFEMNFAAQAPVVTPEPATILLLGTGLTALAAAARRRRKGKAREAS